MELQAYAFARRRVEKPWGYELIWALSEDYCGKLLWVRAGERLSLQHHEQKDETIALQDGQAEIEIDGKRSRVEEPASFRIRPGTLHRLTAITDCTFLEVSTPHLDDVVRHEDVYGRTDANGSANGDSR
jgi:mannose-6-phosphate isomerase-like protein (cupin superfamily)